MNIFTVDYTDNIASKVMAQNKRDRACANNILLKGVIAVKIPGITVKYGEMRNVYGCECSVFEMTAVGKRPVAIRPTSEKTCIRDTRHGGSRYYNANDCFA